MVVEDSAAVAWGREEGWDLETWDQGLDWVSIAWSSVLR